jgi:hypothetical protein
MVNQDRGCDGLLKLGLEKKSFSTTAAAAALPS